MVRLRPQLLQRCALLLIGSQWPLPLQAECRMVAQTLLVTGAAELALDSGLVDFVGTGGGATCPIFSKCSALHCAALYNKSLQRHARQANKTASAACPCARKNSPATL